MDYGSFMFNFSMVEILFLAVLALILIGPKQLPEVARVLGRFITELRRSANVLKEEIKTAHTIEPPAKKDALQSSINIAHTEKKSDEGHSGPE